MAKKVVKLEADLLNLMTHLQAREIKVERAEMANPEMTIQYIVAKAAEQAKLGKEVEEANQTPLQRLLIAPEFGPVTGICDICFDERLNFNDLVIGKNCVHQCQACTTCMHLISKGQFERGTLLTCPDGCSYLGYDELERFVSLENAMCYKAKCEALLQEVEIPFSRKIYCPYGECSFLMDKKVLGVLVGLQAASPTTTTGMPIKCTKCSRLFCASCAIPWHAGLACQEYQDLPAAKKDLVDVQTRYVISLAEEENWMHCKRCGAIYDRDGGCGHMICANLFCGYEWYDNAMCQKCGDLCRDCICN